MPCSTLARARRSGTAACDDLARRLGAAPPARRARAGRSAGGARSGAPSPAASTRGRPGRSPGAADHELGAAAADVDHQRRAAAGRAARSRRGRSAAPPRRRRSCARRCRSARAAPPGTPRRWRRRARRWWPRATTRSAPCSSIDLAVARRAASNTRSIASSASRPLASTPSPSRVTLGAPLELAAAAVLDVGHQQAGGVRARGRRPRCASPSSRGCATDLRRRCFGSAHGSAGRTRRPPPTRSPDLVLDGPRGRGRPARRPTGATARRVLVFLRHYG